MVCAAARLYQVAKCNLQSNAACAPVLVVQCSVCGPGVGGLVLRSPVLGVGCMWSSVGGPLVVVHCWGSTAGGPVLVVQ